MFMGDVFYHLSMSNKFTCIRHSSKDSHPSIMTPRIPEKCHGEDKSTKRVCVASTIWQCILPIPRMGKLFIYRMDVRSFTDPRGAIADIHVSDEKWITDNDVEQHGGEIPLKLLGYVVKTEQLNLSLKIQSKKNALPRDQIAETKIWTVSGEEYVLQSNLMLR